MNQLPPDGIAAHRASNLWPFSYALSYVMALLLETVYINKFNNISVKYLDCGLKTSQKKLFGVTNFFYGAQIGFYYMNRAMADHSISFVCVCFYISFKYFLFSILFTCNFM